MLFKNTLLDSHALRRSTFVKYPFMNKKPVNIGIIFMLFIDSMHNFCMAFPVKMFSFWNIPVLAAKGSFFICAAADWSNGNRCTLFAHRSLLLITYRKLPEFRVRTPCWTLLNLTFSSWFSSISFHVGIIKWIWTVLSSNEDDNKVNIPT